MIHKAIEVAAIAHKNQIRKGTGTPYITHPFIVGMTLLKEGCRDELVIAGILHDTVEDTDITLEYINRTFGPVVADLVEGCSEPDKTQPWEERKRHTLEFLKTAPLDIRIVTTADKLHNITTTLEAYQQVGEAVWSRFTRGREKQRWYYKGLVEVLCQRSDNPTHLTIFYDFKKKVEEIFGSH